MKKLALMALSVPFLSFATSIDYNAVNFHKKYIFAKKVDIPAIKYQILSKDNNPVQNIMVHRYVRYRRYFEPRNRESANQAIRGVSISNINGEVVYPRFKRGYYKKIKPSISLYLRMLYPATQCSASVSRMNCVEEGSSMNSELGEVKNVVCTIPYHDDEIANCFE